MSNCILKFDVTNNFERTMSILSNIVKFRKSLEVTDSRLKKLDLVGKIITNRINEEISAKNKSLEIFSVEPSVATESEKLTKDESDEQLNSANGWPLIENERPNLLLLEQCGISYNRPELMKNLKYAFDLQNQNPSLKKTHPGVVRFLAETAKDFVRILNYEKIEEFEGLLEIDYGGTEQINKGFATSNQLKYLVYIDRKMLMCQISLTQLIMNFQSTCVAVFRMLSWKRVELLNLSFYYHKIRRKKGEYLRTCSLIGEFVISNFPI